MFGQKVFITKNHSRLHGHIFRQDPKSRDSKVWPEFILECLHREFLQKV